MEIIPIIYIKKGQIFEGRQQPQTLPKDLTNKLEETSKLYIVDTDGLEKDAPNLNVYQKLATKYQIWVDAGPRYLEDVVDILTAGANRVTLRRSIFPLPELIKIREITENEVFIGLDLNRSEEASKLVGYPPGIDGFVLLHNKNLLERDFKKQELLRRLIKNYRLYTIESDRTSQPYWKNKGFSGLLVDMGKIKEFNQYGI
jgi:hypothetical protein